MHWRKKHQKKEIESYHIPRFYIPIPRKRSESEIEKIDELNANSPTEKAKKKYNLVLQYNKLIT